MLSVSKERIAVFFDLCTNHKKIHKAIKIQQSKRRPIHLTAGQMSQLTVK